MRIRIQVSNYRCFPVYPPAEFEIGDGVTAFVGENNAGKSAAMRLLHDLRPLFAEVSGSQVLNGFLTETRGIQRGSEVRDEEELVFCGSQDPITLSIDVTPDDNPGGESPTRLTFIRKPRSGWNAYWPKEAQGLLVDSSDRLYRSQQSGQIVGSARHLMDALRLLAKSVYIPSGRHVMHGDADAFDLPVGERLNKGFDQLQTGLTKEHNVLAGQIEDSLATLFDLPSLRITRTMGNAGGLQLNIRNLGQFRSDEVGTGIAQVFAALYTVVTKKPTIVFIDEPELSLHPTLQFRFLAELQNFASSGLVFSTHNLGLAMNAADRVYAVTRQRGNKGTRQRPWSRIAPFSEVPDLAAFLGALSYPSYGEADARQVLLVEGPTDLRIVQLLLLKLGIADQVVAMHIGGNTTILGKNAEEQLTAVRRLCSKVWVLVDSEASSEEARDTKREDFVRLCRRLDFQAHMTQRRAIENYLNDMACKEVFGPAARALGPFESISGSDCGWTKGQAWTAAAKMDPPDFGDVGDFLQRIGAGLASKPSPRPTAEPST